VNQTLSSLADRIQEPPNWLAVSESAQWATGAGSCIALGGRSDTHDYEGDIARSPVVKTRKETVKT
jgi:hypothetical protein